MSLDEQDFSLDELHSLISDKEFIFNSQSGYGGRKNNILSGDDNPDWDNSVRQFEERRAYGLDL